MLLDCPLDLLKIFLLAFSNLKYFSSFKLVDLNMPVLHITAAKILSCRQAFACGASKFKLLIQSCHFPFNPCSKVFIKQYIFEQDFDMSP